MPAVKIFVYKQDVKWTGLLRNLLNVKSQRNWVSRKEERRIQPNLKYSLKTNYEFWKLTGVDIIQFPANPLLKPKSPFKPSKMGRRGTQRR